MAYFTLFIVVVFVGTGCSLRPNGKLMIGESKRTYTLHLPDGYDPNDGPYPVVFILHGNPSKSWQMQLYSGMSKTADQNGFIAVYPDGIDNVWKFDDCDRVEQDVAYFVALLDRLEEQYAADPSRIYFTGISGGSLFLSVLSHALPDRIAAICKVAAGTAQSEDICGVSPSDTPIPMLLILGTDDFLFDGIEDRGILSADGTIDYWLARNRCDPSPETAQLPDTNTKDGSHVTTFHYAEGDAEVVYYRIEGGGHHWPNSRFNAQTFYKKRDLGNLNKDFDANQAIWDFFKDKSTNLD